MDIRPVDVTDVKKGSYIMVEGHPCQITDINRSSPGKHGHAKFRITAVGLLDKNKRIIVVSGGKRVNVPIIKKKNGQVLRAAEGTAQIMDSETYEVFESEIPEKFEGKIGEGSQLVFMDMGDYGKKIVLIKK